MRCVVRGIALGVAATILALSWLALVTARPGNAKFWPPANGAPSTDIYLVSNGYHAGIVLPTAQLAEIAAQNGAAALAQVVESFGAYPFVEIGWGEEQFYAAVPTAARMTIGLAARALFRPGNASVLHVAGLPDHPRKVFPSADIVRLTLSEQGLLRMLKAIDATFARSGEPPSPQLLGRGLYRTSLFYRAHGSFHIFNVCNHWAADMLSAAGLPVTPVLDTVPAGLMFDLKFRAGLERMPGSQP
ncbi:MAG: DUF2459 domain-containing protein [Pseudorhodoplanes sp.]